jgi:hypothetical protein
MYGYDQLLRLKSLLEEYLRIAPFTDPQFGLFDCLCIGYLLLAFVWWLLSLYAVFFNVGSVHSS